MKIVYEIPTYPYERELNSFKSYIVIFIDKIFRRYLNCFVDYIVIVSSKLKKLFMIPVLGIENGVSTGGINIIKRDHKSGSKIKLLFVGNLSNWHGLDIILKSLQNSNYIDIYECHVVSPITYEVKKLRKIFRKLIEDKVLYFHGEKYNEELDRYYTICDIGIGTLAFNRSQVNSSSVLKIREYLSKGLPFIYSGRDEGVDKFEYSLNMNIDENEIFDFEKFHNFALWIKNCEIDYQKFNDICKNKLSWENAMKNVISVLLED